MAEIISMPKLGFDMAEGTLIRWVKAEGEAVEKGELIAEIETDKATVEVESLYTGTILKHLVGEGAIVPVNTPIIVIGEPGEDVDVEGLIGDTPAEPPAESESEKIEAPAETAAPAAALPDDNQLPDGIKATPLARRMAKEKGVALGPLTGTGPGGRIVKRDVEQASAAPLATQASPATTPVTKTAPPMTAVLPGEAVEDKVVPLSRLRQAIGRRMVDSKQNYPSFYVTREFDMGPVMAMRKQANAMLDGTGEKLSVNDFVLKAVALALRQFPNINTSLQGDSVLQHGQVNVGVAVAVENGLLTVVCQNTDQKSVRMISQEIKEKAGRAREGRIQPEDVDGSTFSVSNLGMFGVDSFTAIINPPEAAILAVGAASQMPVVVDGELSVGWRMKATVSVDHRVSDGAEAAQFMQALAGFIENPVSLML